MRRLAWVFLFGLGCGGVATAPGTDCPGNDCTGQRDAATITWVHDVAATDAALTDGQEASDLPFFANCADPIRAEPSAADCGVPLPVSETGSFEPDFVNLL